MVVASVVIVSLVADVVSGLVAGSVVLEIVVPPFFVVLLIALSVEVFHVKALLDNA